MPNLADGLRETIEHRMRFPSNSYSPTFVEEYEREREKERRYEEKRRAKQRQRSRERRALQKAEKELPKIVGWIIFGKNKPYPNRNIDTAAELGKQLKQKMNWRNERLVDACIQYLIQHGAQNHIPWKKPFPYVAAILHREILPEIAEETGVSLEGVESEE